MKNIPLVDLNAQHATVGPEIQERFERLFKDASFILGDELTQFEDSFAAFSEVRHCVGVANGTDALELCLRAASIGPGDEVLVPVNTFAATALAVIRAGARPVFVDSDPAFHLIDPIAAERCLTPNTRAVIPVHLFGQIANMEGILGLADAHDLVVIEDAAQAQGAMRNGTAGGGFGLAAGTSFYPGKNLGAYGDAGAVLTNSDEVARTVRALRNYGTDRKYHHSELGFNSRLDSIQAAVLNVKLKHLEDWNAARRTAAALYKELLGKIASVTLPSVLQGNEHIWHLFVVEIPERDRVYEELLSEGIGAGIHYPIPLHLQPAFEFLHYQAGDFPVAENAARRVLSLPLFPEITEEQQRRVAAKLARALNS